MGPVISKLKLNNGLLYLLVIISFLSYERTLYNNYYALMLIVVLLFGFILLIFNLKNSEKLNMFWGNVKNNISVYVLSFSIILATLLASGMHGLLTFNGLTMVISTVLSIYVFYLFLPILIYEDLDNNIKKLIKIISFFSIIAIIVGVRGSFMGYIPTDYQRTASIFFDSNYFGTIASIGIILSIKRQGKYKFFAFLNLIALLYSGSRAAMLSLVFVMIIFFFYNKKMSYKTIFKFLLLGIIIYFSMVILFDINFFRIDQGLNSRDYLWGLSFELIRKAPIFGYGYGTVGDLIRSMGASNGSSHNSFLDFTIMYGIPTFIINIFIILKATFFGLKNNLPQEITKSILFLLIVSNSISINLGGLGAISLLFTLFLGLSNVSPCNIPNASNRKNAQNLS